MNGPSGLKTLIASCELGTAAAPNFYVARKPSVSSQFESALLSPRVLLMGQNGVGKSTELHQLGMQMIISGAYKVSAPTLDVGLDLRHFGWHELLLYSACFLMMQVPPGHQPTQQFQQLLKIFQTPSFQHLLFKMQQEPVAVHARVTEARAMIWDQSCGLIQWIKNYFQSRPVLLIWDGLEKLSRSETQKLFEEEGRYLEELPCQAVITAPMRMSFERYFHEVADRFAGNIIRLRAMSREQLKELAIRRGLVMSNLEAFGTVAAVLTDRKPPNIYEALMNQLLDASAGLPRQLLQLTAAAARQALVLQSDTLLPEHVALAIRRAAERFRYQLEPADLVELNKADSARTNDARARLLDLLALVEHEEPEAHFRVETNPLLHEMLATGR